MSSMSLRTLAWVVIAAGGCLPPPAPAPVAAPGGGEQPSDEGTLAPADPYPETDPEVATDEVEAPASSGAVAGRWVSTEWASYTNAAMLSADFYLEVAIAGDGSFQGSWARYQCLTQAYGIWSCGKGPLEGSVSGRLDASGTGQIDLERLGRSALTWTARSGSEVVLELPSAWQGQNVLFRATIKR